MALKEASWIHGTSVQLENKSWSALRQGFFTTVRPSNESIVGWVHFAIPTPVIINNVRSKAESALIRFTTGPQASITAFHVYDGEKKIADYNGTNFQGSLQVVREKIPNIPEVVQLIGAGIDFY